MASDSKKNNKKNGIQELILSILSGRKAISHEDVTEQVEAILEERKDKRKTKPKYLINRTIKQLVDDDMIESYQTERSSFLALSGEGRHKLRNIRLSSRNHLVSTTWDGYWRIVIIDIPESRKSERDALRYVLKKAQFIQLKPSIWISPFPLEHMMINMKDDLNLQEELMVIVSDKLDTHTEQVLRNKFHESSESEDEV